MYSTAIHTLLFVTLSLLLTAIRPPAGTGNNPAGVIRHLDDTATLQIQKTEDFILDGRGSADNWTKTPWINLPIQETSGVRYTTKAKILYSSTGVYFLFHCMDSKITTEVTRDFGPLYQGDVVEVFLRPDLSVPIYFEYELSPLDYELPLLVPNIHGKFQGWAPAHYQGRRKVRHATNVTGGLKKAGEAVSEWTAEIYVPFALLSPLVTLPIKRGTRWTANLYRIDHDSGYTSWSWRKTTPGVRGSLHEFKKFGTVVFE
jgi:hypothetical protein